MIRAPRDLPGRLERRSQRAGLNAMVAVHRAARQPPPMGAGLSPYNVPSIRLGLPARGVATVTRSFRSLSLGLAFLFFTACAGSAPQRSGTTSPSGDASPLPATA